MKMYKSIRMFPVMLFAMFFTVAVQAQSDPAPKSKDRMAGKEAKQQKHQDKWEDELKLTPEQKAKFKSADDDYMKKSKSIREDKHEDIKRLRDERQRAHKSALTPEQSAKYDEIMARKEAKKAEKHNNHPKKGDKAKMKKGRSGGAPGSSQEKEGSGRQ